MSRGQTASKYGQNCQQAKKEILIVPEEAHPEDGPDRGGPGCRNNPKASYVAFVF